MKLKSPKKCAGLILAALALGISANTLWAADDIIVGPSGTQTGVSGSGPDFQWSHLYGDTFVDLTFDAATPPPTGDTEGSIYMQNNWPAGDSQTYCVAAPANWFAGATFDADQYESIQMDIKYDTTSTITPAGSANIGIGFDTWYTPHTVTNISFSGSVGDGSWHHLSIPIDPTMPGVSSAHSVGFYKNTSGITGSMNYWVANVKVIARTLPIAPPTTYLSKVMPGLMQFADVTPNWNRDSVRTFTNGAALVSWFGQAKPVVYSFKLTAFPTNQSFNETLCLAPGAQSNADPDWSSPDALVFSISANGNGSQAVNFAYKTNQANANGMLNGSGLLTNFTYTGSVLGTWSLTFTSDTEATIMAPDGSTYSASIPAASAARFADPACFYLYSGMGVDANAGHFVTIDSLSLTGVGTPINQDFKTGSLNPLLVLQSQQYNGPWNMNPPNQFLLTTSNGKYWHHWNLPDSSFFPIVTTNLASGVWQDEAYSSIFANGKQRWALVPPTSLPGASAGFFALVQRTYTQLQVLLPGQTNAPGTALGYVGTPTPISLATQGLTPTTVTVNACDATWHIIASVIDQVTLSTSDGSAFLPPNQFMVNGTASFSDANGILFQTTGSQTVTAQDLTSTTVTATATSAPVTIIP